MLRRLLVNCCCLAVTCAQPQPPPLQSIVFDPNGVGRVDLQMDVAELAQLRADPEAERYVQGDFAYTSPDGATRVALAKVGIRYKGNTSLDARLPKLPLKVKFNQYVKGQRFAGKKKLSFGTEYGDPTFVREALAYSMARRAGTLAPRTQYVRIYVNTQDRGLFLLTEEIDDVFLADHFKDPTGNLYKVSRGPLLHWGDAAAPYQGSLGSYTYQEGSEHKPQFADLIALAKTLTLASDAQLAHDLAQRLDVAAWLDVLAVATLQVNLDAATYSANNFYLYRNPADGRFAVLGWDMDSSFGAFPPTATPQQKVALSIADPKLTADARPLVERVLAVPAWRAQWLTRLAQIRKSAFDPHALEAQVRAMAALIRPQLQSDPLLIYGYAASQTGLDNDVAASDPVRRYPQPFPGLVWFLHARAASVDHQLQSAQQPWATWQPLASTTAQLSVQGAALQAKGKLYVYLQTHSAATWQTWLVQARPKATAATTQVTISLPAATTQVTVSAFVDSGDDGWIDASLDSFGSVQVPVVDGHLEATVGVTGAWQGEAFWASKFGAPLVW